MKDLDKCNYSKIISELKYNWIEYIIDISFRNNEITVYPTSNKDVSIQLLMNRKFNKETGEQILNETDKEMAEKRKVGTYRKQTKEIKEKAQKDRREFLIKSNSVIENGHYVFSKEALKTFIKGLDWLIKDEINFYKEEEKATVINHIPEEKTAEQYATELCKECNVFYKDALYMLEISNDIKRDCEIIKKMANSVYGCTIQQIKNIIHVMNH